MASAVFSYLIINSGCFAQAAEEELLLWSMQEQKVSY
jgi:hypothetical protein